MNADSRSRIVKASRAAVPLALVALAAAVLLRFPPAQYSFYPQCPIDRYLHIQCPGCGTTRALAALLHGNLAEALRLNALTTLLVPPAVIYAAFCYRRFLRRKPISCPNPPPSAIYTALAFATIFTIVRNLSHL